MSSSNNPGGAAFFKRSLAALGAGALSLGAIVPLAGTAVADGHVQNLQAACEGLTESVGFADIQSLHPQTQDAINCLAQYGITQGRSENAYAPRDVVKRYEMAIFLARVLLYVDEANTIGLEVDPNFEDAGFEDLAGVPDSGVAAINFIANLGIAKGKTANLYDPFASVTRRDMASFINRVQDLIATEAPEADYDAADANKEFDDVPATMPRAEDIYALEGAGIVQGTSAQTYKPFANVLRSEMAFFILRHLNENIEAGRVESLADTGEEPPADTTDPTVTVTTPAVGATTVVFTANEDLDDATVEQGDFSGSAAGDITGVGEVGGVITVTLGAGLEAGDTLTLSADSVADLAGNTGPVAAVTATVPTPPPVDSTPPTIDIADILAGVETLTITASEALDASTVSAEDFVLDARATVSNVAVDGAAITLTFSRMLTEGESLTLTAGSVADVAGNTGPASDVSAAVVVDPDNPRPTVDILPLFAGDTDITIVFSEDVVDNRLTAGDIQIDGVELTDEQVTVGTFVLNDDGTETVVLTLATALEADQTVTLEANAVYDQGGNRGPEQDFPVTVQAAPIQQ